MHTNKNYERPEYSSSNESSVWPNDSNDSNVLKWPKNENVCTMAAFQFGGH